MPLFSLSSIHHPYSYLSNVSLHPPFAFDFQRNQPVSSLPGSTFPKNTSSIHLSYTHQLEYSHEGILRDNRGQLASILSVFKSASWIGLFPRPTSGQEPQSTSTLIRSLAFFDARRERREHQRLLKKSPVLGQRNGGHKSDRCRVLQMLNH